MIKYQVGWRILFRAFGSVFPHAFKASFPAGVAAAILRLLYNGGHLETLHVPATWYAGATTLIGFLVIFRTSIAYSRFWGGATQGRQMMVEWFDCASSIVAFCTNSTEDPERIEAFKHTIIRLFSLLHAVAHVELESGKMKHEQTFKASTLDSLELIDVSLEDEYLLCLKQSDCKVELVHTWIQTLLVKNIPTGVLNVPPPILTRAFQELAQGMNRFHECCAIAETPFPFPYSQTNLLLITLHMMFTPIAICSLTDYAILACCMSFLQVFSLWSLYSIATEIEDPFGTDANDLDAQGMQRLMNNRLIMLADKYATTVPKMGLWSAQPAKSITHLSHIYSSVEGKVHDDVQRTTSEGQNVLVLTPSSASRIDLSSFEEDPGKESSSNEPTNPQYDIGGVADEVVLELPRNRQKPTRAGDEADEMACVVATEPQMTPAETGPPPDKCTGSSADVEREADLGEVRIQEVLQGCGGTSLGGQLCCPDSQVQTSPESKQNEITSVRAVPVVSSYIANEQVSPTTNVANEHQATMCI